MGERSDEKNGVVTASGEINVERGAEGVLAREKRGTTKTGWRYWSYTMRWCCVDVETCLVLKRSYPMSN